MKAIRRWFLNDSLDLGGVEKDRIDWFRIVPLVLLHIGAFAAPLAGISTVAVLTAVGAYLLRMFAITGFYHRYFSHRAFRTSRPVQFIFAAIAATAAQRGPLWWASMHRQHHAHTDTASDPHAPLHGVFVSHMGWFLTQQHYGARLDLVADWARFPELRWLDRFDAALPIAAATVLFLLGDWLAFAAPSLNTSGWQMLLWGYCVSTVVLLHVTLFVNSVAHRFGTRRYDTPDQSRNLRWLAWLTLGEGWHNNHHRFAASARQGFFPGETDLCHAGLQLLARVGLLSDLRPVPAKVLREGQVAK